MAANDYIEWQSFALWAVSGICAMGSLSNEIRLVIRDRCGDFLDGVPAVASDFADDLAEWALNRRFGYRAKDWMAAVIRTAQQDPRHLRLHRYATQMVRRRPIGQAFPTYQEWMRDVWFGPT